jgi:hypothetical protein
MGTQLGLNMTYTTEQLELRELLEAKKAEAVRMLESGEAQIIGYPVTDLDHWAEYGVKSVADYDRYSLVSYIWDAYKEAHGFRPRHMDLNEMTMEELEAVADRVSKEVEIAIDEERIAEERATAKFEATIEKYINEFGATDRKTALRWMIDAEDLNDYVNFDKEHADDYVNFRFGLNYAYNLFTGENDVSRAHMM